MIDVTNPLSSMSYTNKDFVSIYTELLDLVKVLTKKWDPSISNESDPGVILVKLNAIIGDKTNYNIDKNILEAFPATVAQDDNARQLFEQLGYFMKWYISSSIDISLKYANSSVSNSENLTIPQFTMFTNADNTTVYTTTQNVSVSLNGDAKLVRALEGVVSDYEIGGDKKITINNLDTYNRLYFNDINVAQNAIFIADYNEDSAQRTYGLDDRGNGWKEVDNLYVVNNSNVSGEKHFKFGVLPLNNTPYIEFPDNVSDLFGQGICIKYIKTNGSAGEVLAGDINNFYSNPTLISDINGEIPSSDVINYLLISNTSSIIAGSDPEIIDEAYRSYKKTVGTFNTLVTLRDYINIINTKCVEEGIISNGFVTDRTNDIQTSYFVVDSSQDYYRTKSYQLYKKDINAFALKLYLLKYDSSPESSTEKYNNTFSPISYYDESGSEAGEDSVVKSGLLASIDEVKSIQHDFYPPEEDKLLFIKNRFPLSFKVYTQTKVSVVDSVLIKENILRALRNRFNSQKVSFGEEIVYDDVYNTIMSSDYRIKNVILDDLVYTSYGVYFDSNGVLQEAQLNNFIGDANLNVSQEQVDFISEIYAKSILNGNTELFKSTNGFEFSLKTNGEIISNITSISSSTTLQIGNSVTPTTIRKNENVIFCADSLIQRANYGSGVYYLYKDNDLTNTYSVSDNSTGSTELPSTSYNKFLSASTIQNCINDSYLTSSGSIIFDFTYDSGEDEYLLTCKAFSSNTTEDAQIIIDSNHPTHISPEDFVSVYGFINDEGDHEVTLTYSTDGASNYIPPDSPHKLSDNEKICVLWRDSNTSPFYNYRTFSSGVFGRNIDVYVESKDFNIYDNIPTELYNAYFWNSPSGEVPDGDVYKAIRKLPAINVLSSNQELIIETPNFENILEYDQFTFITNKQVENSGDTYYQIDFNDIDGNYYYLLKENEHFVYINKEKTEIHALGSGTKIVIALDIEDSITGISLRVKQKPSEDINSIIKSGLTAIDNYNWIKIKENKAINGEFISINGGSTFDNTTDYDCSLLRGTEQEIVTIGEGYGIGSEVTSYSTSLTKTPNTFDKDDELYYKDLSDVTLAKIKIANDDREWLGWINLNIVIGTKEPQELVGTQTITIVDSQNNTTTIPSSSPKDYNFIESNIPIVTSMGDIEINNQWLLQNGIAFESLENGVECYIYKNSTGEIGNESKLPKGNYVIKTKDSLTISGETLVPLMNSSNYFYYTLTSTPYEFTITSGYDESNIKIIKYTNDMDESIKIDTYDEEISTDDGTTYLTYDDIKDKIIEILQNGVSTYNDFDFTYRVLNENRIDYPVDSLSLLDNRHVYNNFVICQINSTYNENYKIYNLDIPQQPVMTIL